MKILRTLRIILVDLDGTLCTGDSFTARQCSKAIPIKKNINKVNKLHCSNYIIIYTARRDHLIPATLEWLRRNNVMYQAISNHKSSADIYIDNRSRNRP